MLQTFIALLIFNLPVVAEINFTTSLKDLRLAEWRAQYTSEKPNSQNDHLTWTQLDIFADWTKNHPENADLVTAYAQTLRDFEKVHKIAHTKIQYETQLVLKKESKKILALVTQSPWSKWDYSEVFGDRLFYLQNNLFKNSGTEYFYIQYAFDQFLNYQPVDLFQKLAHGVVSPQLLSSFNDQTRTRFLEALQEFSPYQAAQLRDQTSEEKTRTALLSSNSFLEAVGIKFPSSDSNFRFFNTNWYDRPSLEAIARVHIKLFDEQSHKITQAQNTFSLVPSSTFTRAARQILTETQLQLEDELTRVLKKENCDLLLKDPT